MEFINKLIENNIHPEAIELSFSSQINLMGILGKMEPDDTIIPYNIQIKLKDLEGEGNAKVIGNIRILLLLGYIEDGKDTTINNLRDVADSYSGDLLTAVFPITNKDGEIEIHGGTLDLDVAFIDHLEIQEEYRNKGIGSAVMHMLFSSFLNSAGVFVSIPSGERVFNAQSAVNMRQLLLKHGFYCADKENDVWVKNTSLL